jgi:hypothetical protein
MPQLRLEFLVVSVCLNRPRLVRLWPDQVSLLLLATLDMPNLCFVGLDWCSHHAVLKLAVGQMFVFGSLVPNVRLARVFLSVYRHVAALFFRFAATCHAQTCSSLSVGSKDDSVHVQTCVIIGC